MSRTRQHGGLPYAIGAYLIWGLLPLYLRLLHGIPPFEFVGWRVIFTLPLCLVAVAFSAKWRALWSALSNPRTMMVLLGSSLLIGTNWLIYIWAIVEGHVLAASLGYYINPLVNVLAGTLFLGERLSQRQWGAVALAVAGVALLAWGAQDMLWISLSLAFTFSGYGLVRKLAPVESLPGLTVETVVLLIPAMMIINHYAQAPLGPAFGRDTSTSLLLALSGAVTAVPLLLFTEAARRMDYSTLGFVQFLSPTLVFLLGLFLFHEPLRPVQLGSFALIWAAAGLFIFDLLARRRVSR
ncbi:MAG: EamA family transporter RarD [Novosphingobium sp.]